MPKLDSRRNFIRKSVKVLTSIGVFLTPIFSVIASAVEKTGKWILPKGINLEKLINKNPGTLDTRNLEPIPLNQFKTMGITDHQVDMNTWRLEIAGQVQKPLRLTYGRLIELPSVERDVLLICPGVFANFGTWKGISLRTLMAVSEAEDRATHVTLRGPEGPYEKVQRFPIADIADDKVFLAYQVNGKVLPQKHGYPLRIVAEGYYGFDWVKFVYKVEIDRINTN